MRTVSEYTISIGEHTVPCLIRHSRRSKKIRITVRHDDTVVVTMPYGAHITEAKRLITKHRSWIAGRLQKMQLQRRLSAPFELHDGAVLPTPFKRYNLKLHIANNNRYFWECNDTTVTIHIPHDSKQSISYGIIYWYKQIALQVIKKQVLGWANKMSVAPKRVSVKNQRTLWGSCSTRGNLNFNWRTMLLSPEALDYLIIHELAHLRIHNHSQHFWKLVQQYCPNYKVLKEEIKQKNHWLDFPGNTI